MVHPHQGAGCAAFGLGQHQSGSASLRARPAGPGRGPQSAQRTVGRKEKSLIFHFTKIHKNDSLM
jgi:hypothetical protein